MARSLLQVDSEQSVLNYSQNETGTPERNLMLAVLERAILDYVGNDIKEREAAAFWLFDDSDDSKDENDDLSEFDVGEQYTMKWVCHFLDLEHKAVLKMVKAMPQRGEKRVAPWYW